MSQTLIRLYRHLADAEAARQALIDLGFSPTNLRLSAQGDEAGAMRGNFILGERQAERGAKQDGTGPHHFRDVEFGTVFLLSVRVNRRGAADAASWLMERFHGEHIDAVAHRARH